MFEDDFSIRLSKLRLKKGVSARDMSLSIGQNAGYINNIESGKSLPSMTSFFYICEYLNVTPSEFFDYDAEAENFEVLLETVSKLKKLNSEQLYHVDFIIKEMAK